MKWKIKNFHPLSILFIYCDVYYVFKWDIKVMLSETRKSRETFINKYKIDDADMKNYGWQKNVCAYENLKSLFLILKKNIKA